MIKEFIPYEQALELKELGFDEPCMFSYHRNNTDYIDSTYVELSNYNATEKLVSAVLYQQSFRWFREKYGYDIHIRGAIFRASYVIGIPKEINIKSVDGYPLVMSWDYIIDETGERKTYEEAELACLKKLIEIVKNK